MLDGVDEEVIKGGVGGWGLGLDGMEWAGIDVIDGLCWVGFCVPVWRR